MHIKCTSAMISFVEVQSGNQPTIDAALSSLRQQLFELNSKRPDAIIDCTCTILCGEQNISLRGHRDANCNSHNAYLRESIYGLKQSSRSWNTTLDTHLKQLGFIQLKSDPCIYHSGDGTSLYIGVYVDDIIIAGRDKSSIKRVKRQLAAKFDIKDLGKLSYFLGISIIQDQDKKTTWMGQTLTQKGFSPR